MKKPTKVAKRARSSNGVRGGELAKVPRLSEMDAALLRLTMACSRLQEPADPEDQAVPVVEVALDG